MVTARAGQSCALAVANSPSKNAIAATAFALSMLSSCGLGNALRVACECLCLRERLCCRTETISIGADAGGVDWLRRALDFGRQIFGEIFRRGALGRHDLEAEFLQPPADGRVVEGVAHRLVELAHDRLGGALGEEKRVPDAGLDARQALLAGR